MLKALIATVAGLIVWLVVATLGNRLLRAGLGGYAEVEAAMNFTLAMQLARLALGAIASLAAGAVAGSLAGSIVGSISDSARRPGRLVPGILAALLFVFFVPAHIALWARFPAWYHASFLASLLLLPTLAGRWAMRRRQVT